MRNPLSRARSKRLSQLSLLIVFIGLRLGVLFHFQADLNTDPDAYLVIARNLANGHGFTGPDGVTPTAFRPPLYPLLLTPIAQPDQWWLRGLFHLSLSIVTFFALWRAGKNLGLRHWQVWLAAAAYTIDPLALRYLAYPMTETLCACLVAILMAVLTNPFRCVSHSQPDEESRRQKEGDAITPGDTQFSVVPRWHREIWTERLTLLVCGVVFGLCVLSRPTFWVFGVLYGAFWFITQLCKSKSFVQCRSLTFRALLVMGGVGLCVVPWVVRNWLTMGTPIVMTTHGGYTLLLGNNEAFYREVVDQPWGTIWDGTHGGGQSAWVQQLQLESKKEGITGEVATDRWLSQRAWKTIRNEPLTFLHACLIKFFWFWNIAPQGPESHLISPWILWGIELFYSLLWCFVLVGLVRVLRGLLTDFQRYRFWLVPVLLVVSLSGVHLIYWSDTRMRAPITTAVVLLAAASLSRVRREESADSADPIPRNVR